MKYLIVLGDGMADEPIEKLGGKTPLQVAHTPYMDTMAREGRLGTLFTVPEGFAPGSEIANLTVLGYDVSKVFEGRGSLEAASMGVEIEDNEVAMRCNIITIEDGCIKNHSAGHISTEEADVLIKYLQSELGSDKINFFTGISYRHLLKIKGADKHVTTIPPHDVVGARFEDMLPKGQTPEGEATAATLTELILASQKLLEGHPINLERVAQGKSPANSIWPWSLGYRPSMKTMSQMYGIESGAVISAVDLIKGIGVYAGLDSIDVEGATGLYDTNYEGKVEAAIEQLTDKDFVFLHIEASDEAGHEGDVELKTKTIEYLDDRVLRRVYNEVMQWDEPVTVAVLPDHPTPCAIKTHTSNAIPFIIWRKGEGAGNVLDGDSVQVYDEFAAQEGSYGSLVADEFMKELILR